MVCVEVWQEVAASTAALLVLPAVFFSNQSDVIRLRGTMAMQPNIPHPRPHVVCPHPPPARRLNIRRWLFKRRLQHPPSVPDFDTPQALASLH